MAISSGNLVTSGSTTYIVGTSSRLDTSALIDNAVAAKNLKADRIDIQVSENQEIISAYSEFQTLAQNVQSALEVLKSPSSFLSDEGNIFDSRTGFVTTSDGSDPAILADIAVSENAALASYDIEVLQTAEAHKVIGGSFADKDADLGYAGTFDIGLAGGGAVATLNVTADMSLQELADAINLQSDTTGVQASVLKVSETDFQLVLTAQETNKAIEVTNVTGDDVLNLVGVTDGVGGFQNILQAEQPAIIEVDGVQITRDDNVFDDLLDGVEINVRNAAPGTIIGLEINNDSESVKTAITNFIDSYNALRDFITQNQQVSSDGDTSNAPLFSDILLENLSATISGVVGADFSSASALETIRDLGLSLSDNNRLVISDEAVLDTAILNNFEEVVSFFSSSATSDNPEFALLANNSSAASQNIVFDITVDGGGNITGVTANGDGSAFTIDGSRIIGATGTIYEGLEFAYQGTTSVTVNTSITQGFADRLYNALDNYANDFDGDIIKERASLEEKNQDLNAEASRIREKTEEFRQSEIERYAEFEAKISALSSLLDQIRAILGTDDDD